MKEKLSAFKNMFINKQILADRVAHLNSRNEMFQIRCMKENDLKEKIILRSDEVIDLSKNNIELLEINSKLKKQLELLNNYVQNVNDLANNSKTITTFKNKYKEVEQCLKDNLNDL